MGKAILFVFLLLMVGFFMSSRDTSSTTGTAGHTVVPQLTEEQMARRRAPELLTIKNFSWNKSGFGTVMQANFTFENKSDFDLKDVVVRCVLDAASGTTVDSSSRTIYEVVPARSSKSIKEFGMGFVHSQASRAGCQVVSAEVGAHKPPPAKTTKK